MADYYPLIARAISGLDPGAPGEARRALYERARTALIAQLRGVQPPLTETEITRERLALEEAVRKVESEAAQRARIEAPKPDPLARTRPGDALRSSVRARATPTDPNAANRATARTDRLPLGQGDRPQDEASRPQRSLRPEPPRPETPNNNNPNTTEPRRDTTRPQPPAVGMQDPKLPPTRERSGAPRPPQPGMRGFRDVVADADDLGGAAAQANRSARRTYANVPSPSPEFDRIEPSMDNHADPMAEAPYGYDDMADDAGHVQDRPPVARPKPGKESGKPAKPPRLPKPPGAPSRFPLKSALVLGLVLILVGVGILVGPRAWSFVKGMLKSQPVAEAPKTPLADNGSRPKIADRVGQPSSSSQIAPVAQKVVLYDEDPTDQAGKSYVGTVVWRTEQIAGSAGQPPDIAVRADIDVPERKLKMTLSIRRNTDASLPASHTAELMFTVPPDFKGGGIANVSRLLMKSSEQAKGLELQGLAVKVTDGFFLVGLSNVDADKARNIQLLKERSWFDIQLVYSNQLRAIMAVEKGAPGERAFSEAFAAWEK
jgi:hypothetical protein